MQSPKTPVALLALVLLALAAAPGARAAPIRRIGSVGFTGVVVPDPTNADWATATGVHFGASIVAEGGGSGAFESLDFMDPVTHQDFHFLPSLVPRPVDPLWIAGDFSFVLRRVEVAFSSPSLILMRGHGYVTGIGRHRRAIWDFVAVDTSFQSTTATVPEPGTLALLGLGLAGAAGLARRRHRR